MKDKIHPNYDSVTVKCACGNSFETKSTLKSLKLDICSACHPFFTGKDRMLDTEGRVEKFQKRFAKTAGKTVAKKPKTKVKAKIVKKKMAKEKGVFTTAPKKADYRAAKTAEKKEAKK
ncbi:MAG: 50S ribosomal protein L31 [Elusimicrobiaceae bacterium]|mgnify:FL=1|jgi:large subunit ribosomal protein L31|nr:50S ribosomal protein L31 [Elusimicrobiaceae bacterium]MBT3955016.1 50S ribosomal protein L31 [Elusimicrobiaceae bacterium]MBT4008092.1 50S ribosomal protein L31 [Elusimicrobiaceae bacterium]MBT4402712.1 50S ribosomal protein L31 [Elusimicrobiaceae bacterium]MBT4440004.1 50S ribosomal protein L31 [Elusimicrobiaceae bacterium]